MEDLERTLRVNSLAIPAIAFSTGILLNLSVNCGVVAGFLFIVAAVCIYLTIIHNSKDAVTAYRFRMTHYVWVFVCFAGAGIIISDLHAPDDPEFKESGSPLFMTGIIRDISETTSGDSFVLDVKKVTYSQDIEREYRNLSLSIKVKNSDCGANIGDIVRISGIPLRIKDNPNSFISGYGRYMASRGIYYRCDITSENIMVTGHVETLSGLSRRICHSIERGIERSLLSKHTQNFLVTVLLGDRSYLDSSLREVFSNAGVAHLLALSGMHMGIIGGIFLFMLYPFNFAGRYKLRILVAAILLWGYSFITGMAPSTVRACVMISFAAIAVTLERKRYVFNSLFGASMIILMMSPNSLFDIGFQLSFICVASLAAFARHISFLDQRRHPYLHKFYGLLTATVVATFGSWVISAYYFNTFPLAFLPANIIAIPFLPIYISIALLYILMSILGFDIEFLRYALDHGLSVLQRFLSWISTGNTMEINVGYNAVVLWFLGLLLLGLFLNVKRWKPLLYCSLSALIVCCLVINADAGIIRNGSFILADTYHEISAVVKRGVKEENIKFERGVISHLLINDVSIISIDCPIDFLDKKYSRDCDYLIIAGGYKGNIKELSRYFNYKQIVIHPTVRKSRELKYLSDAQCDGISCHSLRLHKSLRHLK